MDEEGDCEGAGERPSTLRQGSGQASLGTNGDGARVPGDLDRARIIPNKNRALQVCETSRKEFQGKRRQVFLEWFAGTGNLSLSARMADISYKTVLRHRMTDAGFRADFDEALEQSKVRLKAWAMEAKDDGRTEYDPEAHAPAHLDGGQVVQLLRDEAQRERARDAAAASGRRPTVASNEEVRAGLIRALVAYGLRLRGEKEGGEATKEALPSPHRNLSEERLEEAPPPSFGRSPSPGNPGEDE